MLNLKQYAKNYNESYIMIAVALMNSFPQLFSRKVSIVHLAVTFIHLIIMRSVVFRQAESKYLEIVLLFPRSHDLKMISNRSMYDLGRYFFIEVKLCDGETSILE